MHADAAVAYAYSVGSPTVPKDTGRAVLPDASGGSGRLRIGLVADTHVPEAQAELWPHVFAVFRGCDAILHGGDMHELRVLDQLAQVAPVFAARGNGDEGFGGRTPVPPDDRVRDTWVLEAGAHGFDGSSRPIRIGVIHDLTIPEIPPNLTVENVSRRRFGLDPEAEAPLDVIVYGDTHVERIDVAGGVLCVNPGSPTLPHNLTTQLGTVGFLEIDTSLQITICKLTDEGCETVHEHTITERAAPESPGFEQP